MGAALADGRIGLAAAALVSAQLDRLPEQVDEQQMTGLLENGLPDVLDVAFGGILTADRRTAEQRRLADELQSVIAEALQATGSAPPARLEAAFVLLARALPLGHLRSATDQLLDAVEQEALADREREAYDARSWRLVKKRFSSGFRLEADLTDEDGVALQAEIEARVDAAAAIAAALAREQAATRAGGGHEASAGQDAKTTDAPFDGLAEAHPDAAEPHDGNDDARPDAPPAADADVPRGQAPAEPAADVAAGSPTTGPLGPGRPPDEPSGFPGWRLPLGSAPPPVDSGGPPTTEQLRYQAFMSVLRDAVGARGGRGSPHPFTLLVTTTVEALEGRAGVLPGTLTSGNGALSLSTDAVRRLGCGGALSAVLLDAARNPVGASSTRRHATDRERRALRARQGHLCATNACPNPWSVPHHVEPWWTSGRTVLKDLVGVCDHCHHDVHDGHRVLLLRDGRLIDDSGWVAGGEQT